MIITAPQSPSPPFSPFLTSSLSPASSLTATLTLPSHVTHAFVHGLVLVASRTVAEPISYHATSTGFDAAGGTTSATASATASSTPNWENEAAGDGALAALLVVPLVFVLWLWVVMFPNFRCQFVPSIRLALFINLELYANTRFL